MKVLVVSATGVLGGDVCKRLLAKGHQVRGLVRPDSPKEAEVRAMGVEVAKGDLLDAASLDAATQGIDAIVGSATAIISKGKGNSLANVDENGFKALLAAAKKNGVKRFVYVSVSPNLTAHSPLVDNKREVERAVRASGMTWTVLQPSYFMEVWFGPPLGWKLAEGKGQLFGAADKRVSWIAVGDVAAWAVAALESPAAANQDIPLGGPKALSGVEAHQLLEQTLGKKFKVSRVPGFVPKLMQTVLKPLNPKVASLMALGAATLVGDEIDMSKARSIAKVPETSFEEFARRAGG
ncbi:MAG: SDR family oxidoreductase [Archangiaceae bacterium]|nr:SDR family oxidoreductase [Archangiaceae bacterium]